MASCALGLASCAQEEAPLGREPAGSTAASSAAASSAGSGATGGAGAEGGAGGQGGAAAGPGSGGAPPDTCGNGVLDANESCEGDDFGGLTCQALGHDAGTLVCDDKCAIVPGSCFSEVCTNDADDDGDGLVDCDDRACAGTIACAGACSAPLQIHTVPVDLAMVGQSPNTIGDTATIHPSCTPDSGPDQVYEVIPPIDGNLWVFLNLANFFAAPHDASLSIRTSCDDGATELACVNDAGEAEDELLNIPVIAGQSYFVVIDEVNPEQHGEYLLFLAITCNEEVACAPGYVCVAPWDGFCHQVCEEQADCPTGMLCGSSNVVDEMYCL